MKKVLAINSGSSSFKYKFKLFSLLDEKVIAKGMAIGLDSMALPFVLPWQIKERQHWIMLLKKLKKTLVRAPSCEWGMQQIPKLHQCRVVP